MSDFFDTLFGKDAARARVEFAPDVRPQAPAAAPVLHDEPSGLDALGGGLAQWQYAWDDGDKFVGGFGPTQLLAADYWTLRARSVELFEKNIYARGIIRRLVTNVINVGLHLESMPEEAILGQPEDGLADWAEDTETRFDLWANEAIVCDFFQRQSFGALQAQAYLEALIAGDVLVTLIQDQRTKLPRIKLISGSCVQQPLEALSGQLPSGNKVCHGVELDSNGRQVAYWIAQDDGKSKRLPAYGEKSGRRLAFLVYGTEKRLDDVRGKPILSILLQSLKEIDRYRDSIQRKAVINSILAMYIQKDVAKPGSRALARNATKLGTKSTVDTEGKARSFRTAEHIPGLVLDELQAGEEPKAFITNGTTEEFGTFERAIIDAMAWCLEIPPSAVRLVFESSYSAAQAETIEFRMFLLRVQTWWGETFCQPVYCDWLLSAVLANKVRAKGFLEAWRDLSRFDEYSAWTAADWTGQIKPSIDPIKTIGSYEDGCRSGIFTRARAAREVSGSKFSRNVRQLERENQQIAKANAPLAALKAAEKPAAPTPQDNKKPGAPSDTGDTEAD
jgi:lambda family phage portal protein